MELAERLAEYALSVRFSDLDAGTVKEMKARMIDAVGCALGAFRETPVKIARRAIGELSGGGKSTLLGTAKKTRADLATFVNGLMVRYFDFNDTYLSKEPAHPSDNLSTCFAVGEAEGSGGREVLAAAVAAYEVQCRLCDSADLRHRGWDHVNYGLVSTALAASKLLGLDRHRATHAVNIALNGHIAMRQVRAGELSMWKGASFANAARNGVFAAALAREGMTGPAPIFEGEMGFFKQVSGKFSVDIEKFGGRGGKYRVNETYVKYWPAEYHAQSAVWAAIDVRRRMKRKDEPARILIETHEAGFTILGKDREKWSPRTRETADHSLPFIVAVALAKGSVSPSDYSQEMLSDRSVLGLVKKTRVKEDEALTALYPEHGMPNRVTVETSEGRSLTSGLDIPKGHPLNPMTKDDIEKKFASLVMPVLGAKRTRDSLKSLWEFDRCRDISETFALLKVKGPD
ncbi:MAG TPA: MmgE/PrpD family protein [Nitrososphaerales archaeon]|nr:MmgE/PrpD family protein [Nitrososphaerales archaeon]